MEKSGSQVLIDAVVVRGGIKEQIAILKGDYDLAITLVDLNVHKEENQIQRLLARAYRLKGNLEESKNIIEPALPEGATIPPFSINSDIV